MHPPTESERREMAEVEESFKVCPRYDNHELSDKQIEDIAERAARKAVELAKNDFYMDVGKSVTNKAMWLLGFVLFAIFAWAVKKGYIAP